MRPPVLPFRSALTFLASVSIAGVMVAQNRPPGGPPQDFGGPPGFGGPPPFGPGGPGGPPTEEQTQLVEKFDHDGDKRLNAAERRAARQFIAKELADGSMRQRGPRRPGGGQGRTPVQPGPKLSPADVKPAPAVPLYDGSTVRTLFLDFEGADWEKELSDFHNTDVEVPATLTVDGRTYPEVGVHFRGMSSYFMVGEGQKRSLNLSLDFAHKDQNLLGYRTLNLLNSHEDPSFLRTVLYSHVAREYLPAPKVNLVRVVINEESWGIYASAQQFNKEFTRENFGSAKGARWKVSGSPNGRGSLAYLGNDPEAYRRIYDLKTKENPKAWADLIRLTRVLNQTPADRLEAELAPILDVEGALRFLAVENVLINNDGYWIRSSDYAIYEDEGGKFHIVPHDMNEGFTRPGGPGFGGGPGGPGGRRGPGGPGGSQRVDGVKLDPLVAANDVSKPLISKLLAVPALRERYLGHVHDIADKWLDWQRLGPIAQRLHEAIAGDVRVDGRKLESTESFEKSLTEDTRGDGFGPSRGGSIGLKNFADQRRAFLMGAPAPVQK